MTLSYFIFQVCGGNYSGNSGDIYSPHWPFDYPKNSSCFYNITVPENLSIVLEIAHSNVELGFDCDLEFIKVSVTFKLMI